VDCSAGGNVDQPAFAALPFPSGFCMALSP
jgi:hypothetical protein